MTVNYYDRAGLPITLEEWAALFEVEDYRRVAETAIGAAWVSTIWLGLDHQYGEGPPLVFETMVFGGDFDGHCRRWTTETDALAGHERWVAELEGGP